MTKELIFSIIFAGCITWFGITYLYMLNKIQKHYGSKNNQDLANIINNLSKQYRLFLNIKGNQTLRPNKGKIIVISNIVSFVIPCLLFVILLIVEISKDLL